MPSQHESAFRRILRAGQYSRSCNWLVDPVRAHTSRIQSAICCRSDADPDQPMTQNRMPPVTISTSTSEPLLSRSTSRPCRFAYRASKSNSTRDCCALRCGLLDSRVVRCALGIGDILDRGHRWSPTLCRIVHCRPRANRLRRHHGLQPRRVRPDAAGPSQ